MAARINAIAPDLVGLQEVGDTTALDELVALLDGNWHQRVSSFRDARGIRVAWLSKLAITASEEIDPFQPPLLPVQSNDQGATEATLGRGALAITITTNAGELTALTAHLKSKLLTFPGGRFNPGRRDRAGAVCRLRAIPALGRGRDPTGVGDRGARQRRTEPAGGGMRRSQRHTTCRHHLAAARPARL